MHNIYVLLYVINSSGLSNIDVPSSIDDYSLIAIKIMRLMSSARCATSDRRLILSEIRVTMTSGAGGSVAQRFLDFVITLVLLVEDLSL